MPRGVGLGLLALRTVAGPQKSRMRVPSFAIVYLLVACGTRTHHAPSATARDRNDLEITLYRDQAVVAHRVEVAIPAAATATVKLRVAAGIEPEDIYIIDKSALVIRQIRAVTGATEPPVEGCDEVSCVLDNYERPCCARYEHKSQWNEDDETSKPPVASPRSKSTAPSDIELVIGAPHEGNYTLVVGYDTDRIVWDAGYTMTTSTAHDRVQLSGAISVRNATGISLPKARIRVIDALHGSAAQRAAERSAHDHKVIDPKSKSLAAPRDLGTIDLVEGDTRIELMPAITRPLRSVLVFDPIGTTLDYEHATPVQEVNLGVVPMPSTRVLESFAIDRIAATQHLPAGPARFLERRTDGSLAMLGETRLFGAPTFAATVDTIAIGTADHVTAKRERRDLTIDIDRRRVVEEFAITIDNARDRPIDLILREHLYRGENWTIAYWSVPDITQEGKQQIAMRVTVPPKQHQTVLYVVVYTWGT